MNPSEFKELEEIFDTQSQIEKELDEVRERLDDSLWALARFVDEQRLEVDEPEPEPDQPESIFFSINDGTGPLGSIYSGVFYPEVVVGGFSPVEIGSVTIDMPGHFNRIERNAPYGVMSDVGGKINPFDTRKYPNGDYSFIVTVKLKDGLETTRTFPFTIHNEPQPEPEKPTTGPLGYELPAATVKFEDLPERFRPDTLDVVGSVDADDPDLQKRIIANQHTGKWLVVTGHSLRSNLRIVGKVCIATDQIDVSWLGGFFTGVGSYPELWLAGCHVYGSGENKIFRNLHRFYADFCVFENNGHVIQDDVRYQNTMGAVINSVFVRNSHDPFQEWSGAVVNVSIPSHSPTGSAHPDLLQHTFCDGLYWRDVRAGSPDNPVSMMGIKAYVMTNSLFERVELYTPWANVLDCRFDVGTSNERPGNMHGTIFRDCKLVSYAKGGARIFGAVEAGAKFENS